MASPPDFLAHVAGDSVAVAMRDLPAGLAEGAYLTETDEHAGLTIELTEQVPLGHKFALRDIPAGAEVVEYGVPIATARHPISKGQHAHVHNLRSIRWPN